jgi:hypothetical protein
MVFRGALAKNVGKIGKFPDFIQWLNICTTKNTTVFEKEYCEVK